MLIVKLAKTNFLVEHVRVSNPEKSKPVFLELGAGMIPHSQKGLQIPTPAK